MENYPETYWHCYIKLEAKSYGVVNDISFTDLNEQIITPWLQGRSFTVAGFIVRQGQQVEEIKITHTPHARQHYAQQHDYQMSKSSIADMATDRDMLPIWSGKDYTYELLFSGAKQSAPAADEALVETICKRIGYTARILSNRPRKGKDSYKIEDEYDVQDLLHAVLRSYLKYSVQEDTLQKVANARSSRIDISIEELGVLIEVKYVRTPDDQKRIFEEFSQDLMLYASWQPLKTLFFVIYNSGDLRDPEAMEKLSGVKEINNKRFNAVIILT